MVKVHKHINPKDTVEGPAEQNKEPEGRYFNLEVGPSTQMIIAEEVARKLHEGIKAEDRIAKSRTEALNRVFGEEEKTSHAGEPGFCGHCDAFSVYIVNSREYCETHYRRYAILDRPPSKAELTEKMFADSDITPEQADSLLRELKSNRMVVCLLCEKEDFATRKGVLPTGWATQTTCDGVPAEACNDCLGAMTRVQRVLAGWEKDVPCPRLKEETIKIVDSHSRGRWAVSRHGELCEINPEPPLLTDNFYEVDGAAI